MFANFFHELRAAKIPVTLKEYLTLLEAVDAGIARGRIEDFYYLARAVLGLFWPTAVFESMPHSANRILPAALIPLVKPPVAN